VRLIRVENGETVVAIESLAERDEEEAGEIQAAPLEVIEGEEDLSDDAADDTVEFETQTDDDDSDE
jgi:hypothetical protein